MIRDTSRFRRAISPILATLLLVVIAVAAIAVTYAWVMVYMSSTTTQAGILLRKDAVNWQSNNSITIYVRNVGTGDATIDVLYIGTSSTNLVLQSNVVFDPSRIASKDGGTVAITVNGYQWNPQTTYYFRIVPKVGEALVFQENSP